MSDDTAAKHRTLSLFIGHCQGIMWTSIIQVIINVNNSKNRNFSWSCDRTSWLVQMPIWHSFQITSLCILGHWKIWQYLFNLKNWCWSYEHNRLILVLTTVSQWVCYMYLKIETIGTCINPAELILSKVALYTN